jgi:hypothetical protein
MKPRPYQLKLESNIREGYKQKKKHKRRIQAEEKACAHGVPYWLG